MTTGLPRVCLLVGMNGSLSPAEAAAAAHGIAEPVLVLDRAESTAFPMLATVAESLAESVIVDTRDLDEVCGAVAARGASGVATFVDAYCPVVDEVSARLSGRAAPPGRWHKDVQRELLVRNGVTTVTSSRVSTSEDLSAAVARYGFPVVVKPARGVSSRDVWQLIDAADLQGFRSVVRLNGTCDFVVEPYIRGPAVQRRGPHRADYVSVEYFLTTTATTGFITDRCPLARPCRETCMIGPTTLDAATRGAVSAKADQARRALALGPGAYHIEVKLTDHEPEILEVNGRLGGNVRRLVLLGTGTDLAPAAIRAALDLPVHLALNWQRHVAALHLQAPMGATRISTAPRRREIMRRPGVLAVDHISQPGQQLDWRTGTQAACTKVWLAGADDDELRIRLTDCAAWLAREFDFRNEAGRRVRDDDWLAALAGRTAIAQLPL